MSKSVRKVLKNSFFQTFGGIAFTGLNFLLILGYARILGPESFGSLVGSQAKVLVWALLVDLGLSHGLIGALTAAEVQRDDGARQGFRSRDLIARVLWVRLAGALLGTFAVTLLAYWQAARPEGFAKEQFLQDLAFLPYLYALAVQQTAMAYANFRERQGLSVMAMLAGSVVTVILALTLAFRGESVAHLLLAQSWGGLLSGMIIVFAFLLAPTPKRAEQRGGGEKYRRGPWGEEAWRALLRDAWPYALIYAAGVLWSRLDQITATHWLGNESGGQYGLAVRLVAIPTIMASSVLLALFPDLQRVGLDAPEKIQVFVGATGKFLYRYGILLVGVLLAVVAVLVGPLVPKFQPALWLLPWFVPGVWAYFLHSFTVGSLYAVRLYKEAVFAHAWALGIFVLLLPLGAKIFGLPGVAGAYDIFCLVLFYKSYRALKKNGVLPKPFRFSGAYTREEAELLASVGGRLRRLFRREEQHG